MPEQLPQYDVVYIGNYTKDTIINPAGTKYVDGGAVNYAAHAGARLGCKVAAVVRLAHEDDRVIEKLREAGVDCYPVYTPESTCVRLEYPTDNPDIRSLYVTSTAGSITVADVEQVRARAAVIGTTLRGEVGFDVIRALHARGIRLAADMQGFVRVLRGQSLVYEPWDEMAAVLPYLDILKADAVEAEFLTGKADICAAALSFARLGAKEVVITHKDGVLVYTDGQYQQAGFYPQKLNGRSGRGDTCLGTYAAMRLTRPPREAGIWAAAVTSLKMENLGPFNRTIAEVKNLISQKYGDGPSPRPAAAD
jgi:sugar/nucleoside kinase (ribokinase family)